MRVSRRVRERTLLYLARSGIVFAVAGILLWLSTPGPTVGQIHVGVLLTAIGVAIALAAGYAGIALNGHGRLR